MADDAVTPRANGDRDGRGRFAPGNRIGRGNPYLVRVGALQRAVREAVGSEDLQNVLRKLRDQALDGDAQAASVLLQHVVGRPREAPPEVDIDLPDDLTTASGLVDGFVRIARAAAAGRVPGDLAEQLSRLLAHVADATAIADLTARMARLEHHRAHVP